MRQQNLEEDMVMPSQPMETKVNLVYYQPDYWEKPPPTALYNWIRLISVALSALTSVIS